MKSLLRAVGFTKIQLLMCIIFLLPLYLTPATAIADSRRLRAPKPRITSLSPSSGPVGSSVQILGTGFGSTAGRVKFGKRVAAISSWSDSSVAVTVPQGKKRVTVSLRTAGRKTTTKKFTITTSPSSGGGGGGTGGVRSATVLAVNDLGMHCVDKDFSVFSILPPYNVVQAQVITQSSNGSPRVVGPTEVDLRYESIVDPGGSINSYTHGKTNFWSYVSQLFGVAVPANQGFFGLTMPGDATAASQTSFQWKSDAGMFKAEGIPIYPLDDAGRVNHYPLLRVNAYNKGSNQVIGSTDIVLPVSEETTCQTCHATGKRAAVLGDISWANEADKDYESRINILLLHDYRSGTTLNAAKPVLCASCHYSPALDLGGVGPSAEQQRHETMSRVMHSNHADKMLDDSGNSLSDSIVPRGGTPPEPSRQACYTCHPGSVTRCLRGAMSEAMTCQNCHGGMRATGGDFALRAGGSLDGSNDGGSRRPWQDLPRCQSCHTGDATQHLNAEASIFASDMIRLITAFDTSDPAASPTKAINQRFAENANKLFRNSKGHGGLNCEVCHGSTHAIWPNQDPNHNDNIAATQLQGHAGTLGDCRTCHKEQTMARNLNGPHGLHPVNDLQWIRGHGDFAEHNLASCATCHGADYRGTVLSAAFAARTLSTGEYGTVRYAKGQKTGCYDCHRGPRDD